MTLQIGAVAMWATKQVLRCVCAIRTMESTVAVSAMIEERVEIVVESHWSGENARVRHCSTSMERMCRYIWQTLVNIALIEAVQSGQAP